MASTPKKIHINKLPPPYDEIAYNYMRATDTYACTRMRMKEISVADYLTIRNRSEYARALITLAGLRPITEPDSLATYFEVLEPEDWIERLPSVERAMNAAVVAGIVSPEDVRFMLSKVTLPIAGMKMGRLVPATS